MHSIFDFTFNLTHTLFLIAPTYVQIPNCCHTNTVMPKTQEKRLVLAQFAQLTTTHEALTWTCRIFEKKSRSGSVKKDDMIGTYRNTFPYPFVITFPRNIWCQHSQGPLSDHVVSSPGTGSIQIDQLGRMKDDERSVCLRCEYEWVWYVKGNVKYWQIYVYN